MNANLIILASQDAEQWTPVRPDEVPEWVKAPDNIAQMLEGYECRKEDEGENGLVYRAIRAEEYERVVAAQDKRERRAARVH